MSKTEHQTRIEQFMLLAGQEVPPTIIMPDEATRKLRATLILEEALETIHALGFSAKIIDKNVEPMWKPDLVKIVDGCADISVVTIGTLSACGIPDGDILEIVDNANLNKFGPGSYRREDGKWIKPPNFVAPDQKIAEFLRIK